MPQHDQEFAGYRHNRLALGDTGGQALKNRFPVGMAVERDPSGFDQRGAEVFAARFGDTARLHPLARCMDAGG